SIRASAAGVIAAAAAAANSLAEANCRPERERSAAWASAGIGSATLSVRGWPSTVTSLSTVKRADSRRLKKAASALKRVGTRVTRTTGRTQSALIRSVVLRARLTDHPRLIRDD